MNNPTEEARRVIGLCAGLRDGQQLVVPAGAADAILAALNFARTTLPALLEELEGLRRSIEWLSGNDTGASSEAIVRHMTLGDCDGSYPHDPADLGRCLRLLEKFPAWKPRIGEMACYSPEWKALASRWDELASMMAGEVGIDWSKGRKAQATYAAMRAAIDAARREG